MINKRIPVLAYRSWDAWGEDTGGAKICKQAALVLADDEHVGATAVRSWHEHPLMSASLAS